MLKKKEMLAVRTLHQERGSAIKSSLLSLVWNFVAVGYSEGWMIDQKQTKRLERTLLRQLGKFKYGLHIDITSTEVIAVLCLRKCPCS